MMTEGRVVVAWDHGWVQRRERFGTVKMFYTLVAVVVR